MAVNSQAKAPRAIVGPVIADLDSIGAGDVTIATAFYSMGALNALNIEANSLRLFVRLDLTSPVEWALGSLNPPALRDFIQRHYATCNEVALFVSPRSEEHTSELQSLMRISYAVFCLKKKKIINTYDEKQRSQQITYT